MHILPAIPAQSSEIYAIYMACKAILYQNGIYQWTDAYPTLSTITTDINNAHLYCLTHAGKCIGAICINEIQAAEYASVNWHQKEGKALVVHRLAVAPEFQGKGLAQQLMTFAEQHARTNSYASIRLDAYSDNKQTLTFYEQRGYIKRGEIYFPGRTAVFYCYELTL